MEKSKDIYLTFNIYYKDGDIKTLNLYNNEFNIEIGVGKEKYGVKDLAYQGVIKTEDQGNISIIHEFFKDMHNKSIDLSKIQKLEIIVTRPQRPETNRTYSYDEGEFYNLNMYHVDGGRSNYCILAFNIKNKNEKVVWLR